MFERIYYLSQNHERTTQQILLRTFEATLNLQKAVLKRVEYEASRDVWLPKLFAWVCALMKSLRLGNVGGVVWSKFPYACPFCLSDQCRCDPTRPKAVIDTEHLTELANTQAGRKPRTLREWQLMFDAIYSQSSKGVLLRGSTAGPQEPPVPSDPFLKMYEELCELSEAVRLAPFFPDNLRNESADVLASLFGIANALPSCFGSSATIDLGELAWQRYPDTCDTCGNRICTCRHSAIRERLSSEGVREIERVDPLTGLYNREQHSIDRERLFAVPAEVVVAEMFFDCDDFKKYNDDIPGGHAQGDRVLQAIAKTASEAADPTGKVYRYGGDEFTVLFRGNTETDVRVAAGRVHSSLMALSIEGLEGSPPLSVSVSAGVAFRSPSMTGSDELTDLADSTQYEVKKGGKGRLKFASGADR